MRSVLLAFGLLLASVGHAQSIHLELLPYAQAQGETFTLGEVARIHGDNSKRLQQLVIGRTPRMGYTLELARAAIEAQVARTEPTLRARWSGAQGVKVRGKGQRIAAAKIADAAALEAFEVHGETYKSLELRIASEVEDAWVPRGETTLKTRLQPMHAMGKRLCVWVDIHLDGKPYRSVPVWFEPKAMRDVLVAKTRRDAGDGFRPTDFQVKAIDVAALAAPPLEVSDVDPGALRLRQALPAGAPLLRSQVEARPAVMRQQNVTVKVKEGPILVQSTGVAQADARLGDAVRVLNPRSKEHFVARVVGEGVVLIDGGSK